VVAQKNFAESKSLGPKTLATADSASVINLMAWYRKKNQHSQNALLDKSRVLNSKCPKRFAGRGDLEKDSSAFCAGDRKHT
jgi:hypothetical protein